MSYLPESYNQNKNKIKVELDLSNDEPKSHLKVQQTFIYLQNLLKRWLPSFKLQSTHVNLSKLFNVIKNDVVEKAVCDELFKKG